MNRYIITNTQKLVLVDFTQYFYEEEGIWYLDFFDININIGYNEFHRILEVVYGINYQTVFDLSLLKETSVPYIDKYQGRIYVRPGRWYGANVTYGFSNQNFNSIYTTTAYTNPVTNLTYNDGVGSTPLKKSKLRKIIIKVTRPDSLIDNLQLFVNKMSKTINSNVVVNKTLLHQNTIALGTRLEANRYYKIELDFNEEVDVNDVVQIFFNNSSTTIANRYLLATEIKYIYQ